MKDLRLADVLLKALLFQAVGSGMTVGTTADRGKAGHCLFNSTEQPQGHCKFYLMTDRMRYEGMKIGGQVGTVKRRLMPEEKYNISDKKV